MVLFKSSIYLLHHSHGSARAYCTPGLVDIYFDLVYLPGQIQTQRVKTSILELITNVESGFWI